MVLPVPVLSFLGFVLMYTTLHRVARQQRDWALSERALAAFLVAIASLFAIALAFALPMVGIPLGLGVFWLAGTTWRELFSRLSAIYEEPNFRRAAVLFWIGFPLLVLGVGYLLLLGASGLTAAGFLRMPARVPERPEAQA